MNLIQSMYEKCRYQSMCLKVYMTRYDDTYGNLMGTNKLDDLVLIKSLYDKYKKFYNISDNVLRLYSRDLSGNIYNKLDGKNIIIQIIMQ